MSTIMFELFRYVLFAGCFYAVLSYTTVLPKNHINKLVLYAIASILVVNALLSLSAEQFTLISKNTLQEYKRIPDVNSAYNYNQNYNTQLHDKGLNYYYGVYSPNGSAPEGTYLQNYYEPLLNQQDLRQHTYYNINNCSNCKYPK